MLRRPSAAEAHLVQAGRQAADGPVAVRTRIGADAEPAVRGGVVGLDHDAAEPVPVHVAHDAAERSRRLEVQCRPRRPTRLHPHLLAVVAGAAGHTHEVPPGSELAQHEATTCIAATGRAGRARRRVVSLDPDARRGLAVRTGHRPGDRAEHPVGVLRRGRERDRAGRSHLPRTCRDRSVVTARHVTRRVGMPTPRTSGREAGHERARGDAGEAVAPGGVSADRVSRAAADEAERAIGRVEVRGRVLELHLHPAQRGAPAVGDGAGDRACVGEHEVQVGVPGADGQGLEVVEVTGVVGRATRARGPNAPT